MTFDPTKSVRQGNDRPARIVCTDMRGQYPIVALITNKSGEEQVFFSNELGRQFLGHETDYDLVNVPARTSFWQNVYAHGNGGSYPSREMADNQRATNRLAVVEIILEDGKPVDVKLHPVEC